MVVGLAADAAGDPDLAHHLEHRLVGYARALLRPQAHRDLAVAHPFAVRLKTSTALPSELGPRGPRRVAERVTVGRPGHPGRLQQVGEGDPRPESSATIWALSQLAAASRSPGPPIFLSRGSRPRASGRAPRAPARVLWTAFAPDPAACPWASASGPAPPPGRLCTISPAGTATLSVARHDHDVASPPSTASLAADALSSQRQLLLFFPIANNPSSRPSATYADAISHGRRRQSQTGRRRMVAAPFGEQLRRHPAHALVVSESQVIGT